MAALMFRTYVKKLETRIESLEAFVCSLSHRMSEWDSLPPPECPVCKEVKALDATPARDSFDPLSRTIIEWPGKGK